MAYIKWLNLQLFADGGDGGGGDGAATGETSTADAGQNRLLELGVPADKIRKRASKSTPTLPEGAVRKTTQQAAAATTE